MVDGDTIEVSLDGRAEDVRYIGVDTPESVTPGEPVECFGRRASAFNEHLVAGKEVELSFDEELAIATDGCSLTSGSGTGSSTRSSCAAASPAR